MSPDRRTILLVEDDPGLRTQMTWALADFEVTIAEDRLSALDQFDRHAPPVVVLDLGLRPDPNGASEGLATLEAIVARNPLTKVIVASGNQDRANALSAVKSGAYDFHSKPIDLQVLLLIIGRALYLYDLEAENLRLASQAAPRITGVVGSSPAMIEICRMAEKLAPANISVLITGESGTGKEVLARAIHEASPRARRPFVAINCAAIPEALLESELFGHEKGSFTGAIKQTLGKVEQADTGTLFLDEIGDMPMALQSKMLRFLQERTFERIGGRKEIAVDVRVISATNVDLESKMTAGGFREDLFYRLNEVGLHIPPLRARSGDAVLLAKYLLGRHLKHNPQPPKHFSPEALAAITTHPWPGNVRELKNRVKRSVLMAEGAAISAQDLGLGESADPRLMPTLGEIRARAETEAANRALLLTNNNVTNAALLLGISRPTLYEIMQNRNIKRK
jgi:two-component system NtrC family response regulator